MVVSDTKKAAKAQHRVRDFAGPLVDHDALDRTDLRVIRSVNRRALNLFAANQANCLSFFCGHHILLSEAESVTAARDERSSGGTWQTKRGAQKRPVAPLIARDVSRRRAVGLMPDLMGYWCGGAWGGPEGIIRTCDQL